MARIKWGGSLASFIVIGIILVAMAGGAAYLVQQRGKQVRIDKAATIADQQAKEAAPKQDSSTSSSTTATDATPQTDAANGASTATTTNPETAPAASSALPTTGPENALIQIVGLGMLVAAITSYVTSRHILIRSL